MSNVKLESQDGEFVEVSVEVAQHMKTIKDLLNVVEETRERSGEKGKYLKHCC